jgi:hypothetical protein
MSHAAGGSPSSVSFVFGRKLVNLFFLSNRFRSTWNPFEKSKSKQTEFFVREVKDKRMTKNGPEFLIAEVA